MIKAIPGKTSESGTGLAGSDSAHDGHSTDAGESLPASGWSDRVLGLVCLGVSIWYTIEARTFDVTAFGSGPVGPKTLPTATGVLFGALALYPIIKPDRAPRWPTATAAWQIGLVVVSSYAYGRLVEPVGFIISSIAMTVIIGLLFKAPARLLAPASMVFPVVLAYVFNNWLELRLPAGWWGGF